MTRFEKRVLLGLMGRRRHGRAPRITREDLETEVALLRMRYRTVRFSVLGDGEYVVEAIGKKTPDTLCWRLSILRKNWFNVGCVVDSQ